MRGVRVWQGGWLGDKKALKKQTRRRKHCSVYRPTGSKKYRKIWKLVRRDLFLFEGGLLAGGLLTGARG